MVINLYKGTKLQIGYPHLSYNFFIFISKKKLSEILYQKIKYLVTTTYGADL